MRAHRGTRAAGMRGRGSSGSWRRSTRNRRRRTATSPRRSAGPRGRALDALAEKVNASFAYRHLVERNRDAYERETSALEVRLAAAEKAVAGIMSPEKWLDEGRRMPLASGVPAFDTRWGELRDGMLAGVTSESLAGEANRERFRELRGRFGEIGKNMRQAVADLPSVEIELAPAAERGDRRRDPRGPCQGPRQPAGDLPRFGRRAASGVLAERAVGAGRRLAGPCSPAWTRARRQAADLPQQLQTARERLARFHSLGQKSEGEQSLAEIRAAWGAMVLAGIAEVETLRRRLDILAEIASAEVAQNRLETLARDAGTPPPERFAAWERLPAVSPDGWPSDAREWDAEKELGTPFGQEPYAPVAERFREERRRRWERALARGVAPAAVVPEAGAFAVDDGHLAGRLGAADGLRAVPVLREIARLPAGEGRFPDASWRAWQLLGENEGAWLTSAAVLKDDLDLAAKQQWDTDRKTEWLPQARRRWQALLARSRDDNEFLRLCGDEAFAALVDETALDARLLYNFRLGAHEGRAAQPGRHSRQRARRGRRGAPGTVAEDPRRRTRRQARHPAGRTLRQALGAVGEGQRQRRRRRRGRAGQGRPGRRERDSPMDPRRSRLRPTAPAAGRTTTAPGSRPG